MKFSVRANNGRDQVGPCRTYHGKADAFGVYCPEIEQVFMVPIEDTGKATKWLRIDPQRTNRNWRNWERAVEAGKYRI